jgi:hypothetical protein
MKAPTYVITLRAEKTKNQLQASRALRAALKCLLRSFGLQCVAIQLGNVPEPKETFPGSSEE